MTGNQLWALGPMGYWLRDRYRIPINVRMSTTAQRLVQRKDVPSLQVVSNHPDFMVSKTTPSLVINGVDSRRAERQKMKVEGCRLDTAELGLRWTPGGVYKASTGAKSLVFEVAATARPRTRHIVNRQVRL